MVLFVDVDILAGGSCREENDGGALTVFVEYDETRVTEGNGGFFDVKIVGTWFLSSPYWRRVEIY
jgi:hypothetical protein